MSRRPPCSRVGNRHWAWQEQPDTCGLGCSERTTPVAGLRGRQLSVMVAVSIVRVVQVSVDQVVDMIAMRHRLVPASLAMLVMLAMARAVMRPASLGIDLVDVDAVLVDVVLVRMVKVAGVQIVDVPLVAHRDVAAIGPVAMRMFVVVRLCAVVHDDLLAMPMKRGFVAPCTRKPTQRSIMPM